MDNLHPSVHADIEKRPSHGRVESFGIRRLLPFLFQSQAADRKGRKSIIRIEFSRHSHLDSAVHSSMNVKFNSHELMIGGIMHMISNKVRSLFSRGFVLQGISHQPAGMIFYDLIVML